VRRTLSACLAASICASVESVGALQLDGQPFAIHQVANVYAADPDVIFYRGSWYVSLKVSAYGAMVSSWVPVLVQNPAGTSGVRQQGFANFGFVQRPQQLRLRLSVDRGTAFYALAARADANSALYFGSESFDPAMPAFGPVAQLAPNNVGELGFDCEAGQCAAGSALAINGTPTIIDRSPGVVSTAVTLPGNFGVFALQVGPTRYFFTPQPSAMPPAVLQWIPNAGLSSISAAFVPLSVVAVRMHGTFLAVMSDNANASTAVYRYEGGMGPIPAVMSSSRAIRWTDGDSRANLGVFCGVGSPVIGGVTRTFVLAQHNGAPLMGNAFSEISFANPNVAPASEPGPCRVALEKGPNHLGRGLMVFEQDNPAANRRDIFAQRLVCHDAVDCDDEDPTTLDSCNVGAIPIVCVHTVRPGADGGAADASDAGAPWGDVNTPTPDIVADGTAADGSDGSSATNGDAQVLDIVPRDVPIEVMRQQDSSAVDGAVEDAMTASLGPRAVRFSGGACECRASASHTRRAPPVPVSIVVLAIVGLQARLTVRRRR
jgi:hypothetical protein